LILSRKGGDLLSLAAKVNRGVSVPALRRVEWRRSGCGGN
jgi:hypothetical protein